MAKGKSESKRLLPTIKANEADEEKVKDTRRERERGTRVSRHFPRTKLR